jgi:hypothetical protein
MKRMLFFLFSALLLSSPAYAKMVYGVDLPDTTTVSGEELHLNGYGLRKKLFFKVYLGSLYTRSKAETADQVLDMPGAKLIRMNFIYKKVASEKIVDAFAEGFAKNSPQFAKTDMAQQFLQLFTTDFVAGDQVDLKISADNKIVARHNAATLGSIQSADLAQAVLLIYLGEQPADDKLKKGMLGEF